MVVFGVVVVVSLVIGVAALFSGRVRADTIQTVVAGGGAWSMVGFVIALVVAELLWMPRLWGLLAAGVLFGPLVGAVLCVFSDTIAAIACFLVARSTAREFVTRMIDKKPVARRVLSMLAHRGGIATVAFLRVCPVAHHTVVSYASGLAGVPTRSFLIGHGLGIIPGAVLYPVVGDAALRPTGPVFLLSTSIVVAFLVITLAVARRALRREADHDSSRPSSANSL